MNSDVGNVVRVKAGPPRVGKTSQAVQDSFVLAMLKWRQLQYDFWSWHSREAEILKRNNTNELLEYNEIKQSYNFYIMRRCIPCLWSNIAIQDSGGRRSHKITINHIKGVERLPIYSVVMFDEIGAVLRTEDSNNKANMYDVSDMFRLGGQFLKWCVICCEQDFSNIYIDCRRVVGVNELISSQEWICRPAVAYGVYKILNFLIVDNLDKQIVRDSKLAKFMSGYAKFVYGIGFRRQIVSSVCNTQTGGAVSAKTDKGDKLEVSGRRIRYIPSRVAAGYDDRAYKQEYASYFDREIKGDLHQSLCIDARDTEYARQFVSETTLLNTKREAIDDAVKKIA